MKRISLAHAYEKDKAKIRRNFNAAADTYDQVAVLQRVIGERLLERLEVMRLRPRRILDLGSGTGLATRELGKRYKKAQIVQLDLALSMLMVARRQNSGVVNRQYLVCADAESLPLDNGCADMVFSNLMFQWAAQLNRLLAECCRVLRPGALCLFSTFGPDSLKELRQSWAKVDEHTHVNAFLDMHDIGDALIGAGFVDPVMERERFSLLYDDGMALMQELKRLGAGNVNAGRRKSLMGKAALEDMLREYKNRFGAEKLPATFEAIYGHAWAPLVRPAGTVAGATASFPVSALKARRGS